jgi:hypothetical protein
MASGNTIKNINWLNSVEYFIPLSFVKLERKKKAGKREIQVFALLYRYLPPEIPTLVSFRKDIKGKIDLIPEPFYSETD